VSKRLAITISGAVSLGSYEAGVLYEIIHAIGEHNQTATDATRIEIDVLTGASAGGMTATIAAQKLAFEADALEGPYDNCFYRPWVADISLEGLLAMHGDDEATKSVLSSQLVEDISVRYLTQRYQSHMDPPRLQHPAAARLLRLGLALSNLNGVDYGLPLLPKRPDGAQDQFIYTRHQDQLVTWIEADKPAIDDIEGFWEPLRNACVSCGAFAFAFRVIDVVRHAEEYADSNLVSNILPTQNFAYTDGGTFQNEPLGLAKNLVDEIDHHQDVANRFYLFVSPGSKSSTANGDFNAGKATYQATAVRLVNSIFGQARFQDWIMAEGINEQIALYNTRAIQLKTLLLNGGLDVAAIHPGTQALLPLLFANNPKETQAAAWQRVRDQFKPEYDALLEKKDQPTADRYIDMLLTLETAAQLGDRDEMNIYGITASDAELASSELFAFAGFFDRRYRDHDYDVGRTKAQAFLASPGALGPIKYKPEAIREIDASLNGLKLENMDRDTRIAVRDRLRERAHTILQEMGVNPWLVGGAVREAIDVALIKPQLDKLLKL
jgi:hypothetical protein